VIARTIGDDRVGAEPERTPEKPVYPVPPGGDAPRLPLPPDRKPAPDRGGNTASPLVPERPAAPGHTVPPDWVPPDPGLTPRGEWIEPGSPDSPAPILPSEEDDHSIELPERPAAPGDPVPERQRLAPRGIWIEPGSPGSPSPVLPAGQQDPSTEAPGRPAAVPRPAPAITDIPRVRFASPQWSQAEQPEEEEVDGDALSAEPNTEIYQGNGKWYHPADKTLRDADGNILALDWQQRNALGHFVSGNGGSINGSEAEAAVWKKFRNLGMPVIEGRVYARRPGFPDRVYDGAFDFGDKTLAGIETKNGNGKRSAHQREFDSWVNSGGIAEGVGKYAGYKIIGVYFIKR
jgi:hypothetical protein